MSKLIKYSFSELYNMSSGISSTPEQAGHGAPFVSFSTVFNNYFLPDVLPDLMDTSDKEQVTYSIKKDDILLTRTSETIDELAFSCVATKDYPTATYSGFTKRLRPNEYGKKLCYSKYLAFYLRSYLFRKLVTNNAFMTLRASFNETIFSFLYLHLPDYQTQIKVGNFLYTIEEKIKLNNRINAELESMAKTLYDYWFVQFDFPNKDGKPYKSSGGKMVYNEELKRDIPEGWEVEKLSDIANITMGQSPLGHTLNAESNGMVFFQGSTDFGWRYPSVRMYTTKPTRFAKQGDILLSVRAPVGTMNIASMNCCIGRGLAAINSKTGFDGFLFYALQYMQSIFERKNTEGTTFGSITKNDVHFLPILYPKKELLGKYNNIVENYNKMIFEKSIENQELAKLRDWLLPMLMNGQVRVL